MLLFDTILFTFPQQLIGHFSKIIYHVTLKKEQDRNSHQSIAAALLWNVKSI